MTAERTFPNDPASVAAARRYALEVMGELDESLTDAAALMVSELSANAVRHTPTHFTLTVDRTATRIRVSVADTGPGQPVVRRPDPTEPSGRGLQIVDALADEWGIEPTPDGHGKTVWFTMSMPPASAPAAGPAAADAEPSRASGAARYGESING